MRRWASWWLSLWLHLVVRSGHAYQLSTAARNLLVKLAEAQANAAIDEELGDIDGVGHRRHSC